MTVSKKSAGEPVSANSGACTSWQQPAIDRVLEQFEDAMRALRRVRLLAECLDSHIEEYRGCALDRDEVLELVRLMAEVAATGEEAGERVLSTVGSLTTVGQDGVPAAGGLQ